jgi:hypothetical protein
VRDSLCTQNGADEKNRTSTASRQQASESFCTTPDFIRSTQTDIFNHYPTLADDFSGSNLPKIYPKRKYPMKIAEKYKQQGYFARSYKEKTIRKGREYEYRAIFATRQVNEGKRLHIFRQNPRSFPKNFDREKHRRNAFTAVQFSFTLRGSE